MQARRGPTRRAMIAGVGSASLSMAWLAFPAQAAAPLARKQAPGFYRMMLGDFEVTALLDGTMELPVNRILNGIQAGDVDALLADASLRSPLETSYTAYLINTGEKLVLIDTGAGRLLGPTLGNVLINLRASGYEPGQVDEIYLTHLHADHMGGLVDGEHRVFPNAVVRADKADSDHWLSTQAAFSASAPMRRFYEFAQIALGPYIAAGRFIPFEGSLPLASGFRSRSAGGHTPGHCVYEVESRGHKLTVLGDLMHVAAVQFQRPRTGIQFDSNSQAAADQRVALYEQATAEQSILAISHVSFPGLGRLRKQGPTYQWQPVNYTALR